jgi:hypothetical protein
MQSKKPSLSFAALSGRLYYFLIGLKPSVSAVSEKYQPALPRFVASLVDGLFLIPLIIIQVVFGRYLTGSMMGLLLSAYG